ncbi:MAG: effector binding domain-containing protein [Candidatus Heimdallarchaeota archaeon]|nr:effector binding domain-containing protein [Candidatus Heimdallarchaeota archaeon]
MDETTFSSNEKLARFLLESKDELSAVLQALSYDKRLHILAFLVNEKQSFAELQERTGFQASMLSNHLSGLYELGFVKKPRRGIYDITADGLDILQKVAEGFLLVKIREQEKLKHLESMIKRYTDHVPKGDTMRATKDNISVRIVELLPFRYARFHAMGTSPEEAAAKKMNTWAKPRGYYDDFAKHPIYGFNNPNPEKGKNEYGYEFWIQVEDDLEADDAEIIDFPGGRFAVTTAKLFVPGENVIPEWPALVNWVKDSEYEISKTNCEYFLEKAIDFFKPFEEAYIELYVPID